MITREDLPDIERVVPRMNFKQALENAGVNTEDPQKNLVTERRQTKVIVDDTKIKHPSGASSSHEALRYDLIPREGLAILAERYTVGVPIHGARNYQQGLADKKFILDRLNHIQEHYQKLIQPRKKDKEYNSSHKNILKAHLGAIMWGCCFLAEVLEDPEGEVILINDIINWK
jgi:hypothetical protein